MSVIEAREEGVTLIVIAHRLATIAATDRIVFMKEGRIVVQGTHEELLQLENGRYREFVSLGSD